MIHFWQKLTQLQRVALSCSQLIELLDHRRIVILRRLINRENPRSIADADCLRSGQQPVDVPGQRGYKINVRHMLFLVKNRLIQMGNAPPLRDVELEFLSKLLGRSSGCRIPPGPERNQQLSLAVKRHISVHHGRESDRPHLA
ncbi:hypothetical protein D3C75_495380 [compost metagenome]